MAVSLMGIIPVTFAATLAKLGKPIEIGLAYVPPLYQAGMKFRTQETIDMALAEGIAKTARSPLKTSDVDTAKGSELLAAGTLDALVTTMPARGLDSTMLAVATGYAARPMAIMRTDTTIKTADQLRGRKVCVSEGGAYVGRLSSTFGAIEKVMKAPADSLLAVRTGACDAAVHDSALLEELIKLPEWKKFSASLYLGPTIEQAILVRRDDTSSINTVKNAVAQWKQTGFIKQEMERMVRHIAFEVYLDQNVPDCH